VKSFDKGEQKVVTKGTTLPILQNTFFSTLGDPKFCFSLYCGKEDTWQRRFVVEESHITFIQIV
jgi:hypothetical protein